MQLHFKAGAWKRWPIEDNKVCAYTSVSMVYINQSQVKKGDLHYVANAKHSVHYTECGVLSSTCQKP